MNAVTVRDSYPIPRIDMCIVLLQEVHISSTLNANLGYRHIAMDDKDVEKTAVVIHHNLCMYS